MLEFEDAHNGCNEKKERSLHFDVHWPVLADWETNAASGQVKGCIATKVAGANSASVYTSNNV